MTAPQCFNGDGRPAHITSAYCQECIARQAQPLGRSSADCGKCGARFVSVTLFDAHQDVTTWSEVHDGRTTYHGSVTCLPAAAIPGLVQSDDGIWGAQASFDRRTAAGAHLAASRWAPSAPYAAVGGTPAHQRTQVGLPVPEPPSTLGRFPPTEQGTAA